MILTLKLTTDDGGHLSEVVIPNITDSDLEKAEGNFNFRDCAVFLKESAEFAVRNV